MWMQMECQAVGLPVDDYAQFPTSKPSYGGVPPLLDRAEVALSSKDSGNKLRSSMRIDARFAHPVAEVAYR
jgi:hypothetical protein